MRAKARIGSARDEAGFMLVELLVATMMLTVVLGAVLVILERTTQASADDQQRAHSIRSAQVELDVLMREARHAYRVNPSTATVLDLDVHMGGRTRRVVFNCAATHPTLQATFRCTRHEVVGGGTTPPTVVVDRVRNTNVFSYTMDGTAVSHVGVSVHVPASGEQPAGFKHLVRLDDGFEVRNRGLVP